MKRSETQQTDYTSLLKQVTPQAIEEARNRIQGSVVRTPLVPLELENSPCRVFLKLENLQPTGSFKVRGASNAIALSSAEASERGVYTVSAGNMAQALAWLAKRKSIPCSVVVPDNAPMTKLEGVKRQGAKIIPLPFDRVWNVAVTHRYAPLEDDGWVFIHPFEDPNMIAGNGTIGLEIIEDMPDLDSVVVPFGGGGLAAGIATAVRHAKPSAKVFACEPETASPLAASFAKGSAQEVNRAPSFVDGIGAKSVLPGMWHFVRNLLEASIVVSLAEIANSIRLLVERSRVVAEGAGAASVAGALAGKAGKGSVVCIVSGGNIDSRVLARVLEGHTP